MTEDTLEAIASRAADVEVDRTEPWECGRCGDQVTLDAFLDVPSHALCWECGTHELERTRHEDIPALVAEVRRLQAIVTESAEMREEGDRAMTRQGERSTICLGCEKWLADLSIELRTQDNASTANPLFCVQEERFIWGLKQGYSDLFVWQSEDDREFSFEDDEVRGAIREEYAVADLEDSEIDPTAFGYEEVFYGNYWDFVSAHFTGKAADRYIRENAHNLNNPRVFVTSQYRCDEWNRVRAFLMEKKP